MSSNISRRSLAKGAAWAAPAVVATAAVPAYAASSVEPTYNYVPSASWTSTTTWYNRSDYSCTWGEGVLQTLNFHTVANPNVPDYSGWGVRPVDGAPTVNATITSPIVVTLGYPAGMAQSIALTSGDYTVSGPTRQYLGGSAHDVWTFTFTGAQSAPTGGSWPGSVIRTSITPVRGKCWPQEGIEYKIQFAGSFKTDNGVTVNMPTQLFTTAMKEQ